MSDTENIKFDFPPPPPPQRAIIDIPARGEIAAKVIALGSSPFDS